MAGQTDAPCPLLILLPSYDNGDSYSGRKSKRMCSAIAPVGISTVSL
jgi:hypothetical protein